jgi:uncharacterized membrane protein
MDTRKRPILRARPSYAQRITLTELVQLALRERLHTEVRALRLEAQHMRGELLQRRRAIEEAEPDEQDNSAPMDTSPRDWAHSVRLA